MYIYNKNGRIASEINNDNYYIYYRGTELLGSKSYSGDVNFCRIDGHGSVTAVLSPTGEELKSYNYDAFGAKKAFVIPPMGESTILFQWKAETDGIHNPFGYCGEYVEVFRIKKKILIFSCILVMCISLLSLFLYNQNSVSKIDVQCVTTQDDAIAIAKVICNSVYPQFDYESYTWKCIYNEHKNDLFDDEVWVVWCSKTDGSIGGLPEIHIKKNNAQVVKIMLTS